MLAVDRTLRGMGCAGFETQVVVTLRGKVDADYLRTVLKVVCQSHPVIDARFVEFAELGPCWEFPAEPAPLLHETTLATSSPEAVLEHAGKLQSRSIHPEDGPPIRFHLLHLPNGRDALVIQFNHMVMDHASVLLLLKEIARCWRTPVATPAHAPDLWEDPIRGYMLRFPRARRRLAAKGVLELQKSNLHRGGVQVGRSDAGRTTPGLTRVAARRLNEKETAVLQERMQRAGGLPSLSLGVLASAFRTVARLTPNHDRRSNVLHAGIGVDLGMRASGSPQLGNLMSMVPLFANLTGLHDRDGLVRALNGQMRERLAADADLGMLSMAATFGRIQRQARWTIELLLRYAYSLWFAYFGSLDVGDHFCGQSVEEVFSIGPCWPPMGLTLLVNQHRKRLLFQLTYVPSAVPTDLANRFLETLLSDLMS
jgi:hypothetical protein